MNVLVMLTGHPVRLPQPLEFAASGEQSTDEITPVRIVGPAGQTEAQIFHRSAHEVVPIGDVTPGLVREEQPFDDVRVGSRHRSEFGHETSCPGVRGEYIAESRDRDGGAILQRMNEREYGPSDRGPRVVGGSFRVRQQADVVVLRWREPERPRDGVENSHRRNSSPLLDSRVVIERHSSRCSDLLTADIRPSPDSRGARRRVNARSREPPCAQKRPEGTRSVEDAVELVGCGQRTPS